MINSVGIKLSLIVGTVMEGSRTTLQKWVLTMHLLIHDNVESLQMKKILTFS
ncbi:hypothetical protein FHS14_005739 [Paenibacillus baekrokdamisoli]|uniref:hypothetical protein n=1 Tax=Paenibacillus baekrokdamisoli TaxID=1712516 RepID=UPI0013DECA07|nr:hypothetical protein [Paenibacillus baekrokdamisoli]MBB3072705.1 hypothetical protein [Paenibacillus baekrokdamisoli]